MAKTDRAAGPAAPPSRPGIWLVAVLLLAATSRLPVQPSTARFGSHPSKKSRTCPAEQSVRSLPQAAGDRAAGFVRSHPVAEGRSVAEPSFRGLSPVVETRLLAGSRRPDYLNFFAPAFAHNDLPPPRA